MARLLKIKLLQTVRAKHFAAWMCGHHQSRDWWQTNTGISRLQKFVKNCTFLSVE